ncbi:HAMP domain-containing histidine kinase [Flavihumibacter sp. R14]|nr:HAMP domain-containing histidine kinase [Flavihumibacter soli]
MDKETQADELLIVNRELVYQNQDKGQSTAELLIANQELGFELIFQNSEKEKRAAELVIANIQLNFQELEREKRAAELVLANIELNFQNAEKGKRAAELIIANEELLFHISEKEKRAAELIIANKELLFQNEEKEKRAAELVIANEELIFQNREKEKRAAELIIANKELVFQNLEKEIRAAELVIANKELVFQNREKEKRAEAEAKKDEFFNMVSHELKTPLTNIKAINQLLEKTTDKTTKSYPFILKANHNIKRLERLIEDLLDVTKINSGNVGLLVTEFPFSDMLLQSISSVQQLSLKHRIILQNSTNILYKGDQFRLEQVMVNLLTNAIKYSPEADKVLVTAVTEPGYLVVCVQDFGIGIAKKDIDQLFDRFFRVNEIAMAYEGMGLGLYIASEIVKKHGGDFSIQSEPGKGSSFCFRLPLDFKKI